MLYHTILSSERVKKALEEELLGLLEDVEYFKKNTDRFPETEPLTRNYEQLIEECFNNYDYNFLCTLILTAPVSINNFTFGDWGYDGSLDQLICSPDYFLKVIENYKMLVQKPRSVERFHAIAYSLLNKKYNLKSEVYSNPVFLNICNGITLETFKGFLHNLSTLENYEEVELWLDLYGMLIPKLQELTGDSYWSFCDDLTSATVFTTLKDYESLKSGDVLFSDAIESNTNFNSNDAVLIKFLLNGLDAAVFYKFLKELEAKEDYIAQLYKKSHNDDNLKKEYQRLSQQFYDVEKFIEIYDSNMPIDWCMELCLGVKEIF